jgi:small subunit ribosomal protein S6
MKRYESVIIVNSSLNEETLNRITSRLEDFIKKHGGNLINTNLWGKRRLAYPLKKFQYGFYVILDFEAPSGLVGELEREYRLNEHILRYMTLYKDKKAILAEQKRKAEEDKLKITPELPEIAKIPEELNITENVINTEEYIVSEKISKRGEPSADMKIDEEPQPTEPSIEQPQA